MYIGYIHSSGRICLFFVGNSSIKIFLRDPDHTVLNAVAPCSRNMLIMLATLASYRYLIVCTAKADELLLYTHSLSLPLENHNVSAIAKLEFRSMDNN